MNRTTITQISIDIISKKNIFIVFKKNVEIEFYMEKTSAPLPEPKYKFKELRIYNSNEWLAEQKQKYRQVFDRHHTAFVYVELSFYNKQFDIDTWDTTILLKCYSLNNNKHELCHLVINKQVHKYESTVYVKEGWGNKKEGAFWKKGAYYWEAWIDNERVGSKYFYIEDAGEPITRVSNPYFDINSLKFYEGSEEDTNPDDRIYLKVFSAQESRMLHLELMIKNKNRSHQWQCELFFRFFNELHELKGQVTKLTNIKKDEDQVSFSASIGMPTKGHWKKESLYMEILFLDHVIAHAIIDFADAAFPGQVQVYLPNQPIPGYLHSDQTPDLTFDELMSQLNEFIGLQKIKKQVKDHAQYLQFVQIRKQYGFKEKDEINIHSVFIGNPGTGKTTIASLMGMLYHKMGLLSKGHVHHVDRVDLVGEYIGQTAPKVKDAIEKARGGVLFIDEAYALARSNDDSKDFGREVIEILVKEMSNGAGDLAVIVAGYPKEMKYFLESNPGLKSRFKLYYEFADYTPDELYQIALLASDKNEVTLSDAAKTRVHELIIEAFRNRNNTFGNARFVHDLITKAKINLGMRYMQSHMASQAEHDKVSLSQIALQDVQPLEEINKKPQITLPIDHQLLQSTLSELDALIGMHEIKKQIHELVEVVQYYLRSSKEVLQHFYLHTLLIGNPGTGKTTVARILSKLYKSLGILERGHMIETDRQGLVAGFVGQSAIKTAEKIDEALGGVLFIDEAYSLISFKSHTTDYGHEVIQTLLKRMEDKRGEFFVFAAGYPDNMDDFIKANPGLASRFDKTFRFDDYTPAELMQIASKMIHDQGLILSDEAQNHLTEYLSFIHNYRDKYFGNARTVRSIVLEAIQNQTLRLAHTDSDTVSNVIDLEDVRSFKLETEGLQRQKKTIGYIR